MHSCCDKGSQAGHLEEPGGSAGNHAVWRHRVEPNKNESMRSKDGGWNLPSGVISQ